MDGKNGLEPGVTEARAAPARAQNASGGDAVAVPSLRFSAKRKLAAVQRLQRSKEIAELLLAHAAMADARIVRGASIS